MHRFVLAAACGVAALALPFMPALAHERQAFSFGDTTYLFTIGSLGEPVYVDDKSGVDLRVTLVDPKDPGNRTAAGAAPVTGLEQTLQVELQAADKKKTLPLSPAYGDPGAYKAAFFPTVATALSYRVFGALEGMPVDLTFTCKEEGETSAASTDAVPVAEGVTRVFAAGGFDCPKPKEDAGFPEASPSLRGLQAPAAQGDTAGSSGVTFGLIGMAFGAVALARSGRKS